MVTNPNHFGKLTLEELTDFEKTNQISLPEGYKKFLLKNNGGKPFKNTLQTPSTVIDHILGMHNGDYYASLYKHIHKFADRLPLSTFPVGNDAFGNLLIMSVHPDNYGQIFFWEQEGESAFQDGHYIDNVTFVAYSFDDLIDNLH